MKCCDINEKKYENGVKHQTIKLVLLRLWVYMIRFQEWATGLQNTKYGRWYEYPGNPIVTKICQGCDFIKTLKWFKTF